MDLIFAKAHKEWLPVKVSYGLRPVGFDSICQIVKPHTNVYPDVPYDASFQVQCKRKGSTRTSFIHVYQHSGSMPAVFS